MDRNPPPPQPPVNPKAKDRVIGVLGLGVNAEDGHTRISKGEHFQIYLGSDEAHETMLALCVKIERRLTKCGMKINDLNQEEFIELLKELGDEE